MEKEKQNIDEKIETLVKEKAYEYSVLRKVQSALFSDVSYVRDHWAELTNERCTQIFADFQRSMKMSEMDFNAYQERLKMLEERCELNYMLGGHTHEAGKNVDGEPKCVEGPRFYSSEGKESTRLSFGRLRIQEDGDCKYEFSHPEMGRPIKEHEVYPYR